MATPYLDEAERCARVALLHQGRLLADEVPERLQGTLDGQLLEVMVEGGRPPIETIAAVPGVSDVQVFGDRAHVRFPAGNAAGSAPGVEAVLTEAGRRVTGIRPVAASLEDVFIDLIGRTNGK
jgi:ABC-2 type transport system ATP-binding protein